MPCAWLEEENISHTIAAPTILNRPVMMTTSPSNALLPEIRACDPLVGGQRAPG